MVTRMLLCFNTSHVTLYHLHSTDFVYKYAFQYISCYSLSEMAWWPKWSRKCFNTSHVTLYHGIWRFINRPNFVSIHLMLLFIFFCVFRYYHCSTVSIHLMLLFIMLSGSVSFLPHFVSIHLMLLFIQQEYTDNINTFVFQYISCYSLSDVSNLDTKQGEVSIHLMLLFIKPAADE